MGDSFWLRIQEAIDASRVVLVVLTPESAASSSVHKEIARAEATGRTIVPMLLRECVVPIQLGTLQQVDVVGGRLPEPGFLDRHGVRPLRVAAPVPGPPAAGPGPQPPTGPERELAVRRFLDENPPGWGWRRQGYQRKAVTPMALLAVVEHIADARRCFTVRPPYFPLSGEVARSHDKAGVDAFVLSHRPAPTDFRHGLRLVLWDADLLHTHDGGVADGPVLGSAMRVGAAVHDISLSSVSFTEGAVSFHCFGDVLHVPYRDVAAVEIEVRLREEDIGFTNDQGVFPDIVLRSSMTVRWHHRRMSFPETRADAALDERVATAVRRIGELRARFPEPAELRGDGDRSG